MSKIIVIGIVDKIDKNIVIDEIIKQKIKIFVLDDKHSVEDVINTLKSEKLDSIIIDYSQPAEIKDLVKLVGFVKQNNIDLYLIIHLNIQNPTLKDIHPFFKIIAKQIIFLHKKDNQIIKKTFNKSDIEEFRKSKSLDVNLGIGKLLEKYIEK